MKKDIVLEEAKRLYDLGFAILWIRPRAKNPVESGWTTGPRQEWRALEKSYRPGYNIGVRTGTPSQIAGKYLTCIDVDIKDEKFEKVALAKLKELTRGRSYPEVRSGGGFGSRHLYALSSKPFKMITVAKEKGWEICLYSDGRQMVLPPSIHPSGRGYRWERPINGGGIPEIAVSRETVSGASKEKAGSKDVSLEGFNPEPVDLAWLPISDEVREGIVKGTGITDRSRFLLRAASALHSAGLSRNEVLTILTDPDTFLGRIGYDHAKTTSRAQAAAWVYRFTFAKIESEKEEPSKVFAAKYPEARKLTAEEEAQQTAVISKDIDWTRGVLLNQQGFPLKLVQNVVHIISNAVSESVVQRDEFAFRDTYSCDTAWGGKKGDAVSDDDVAVIKFWLGTNYKFEPTNNTISDALIVLARQNAYDPVREMLDGLPPWDKTKRLDTWLATNFNAKGDPEYLAQVFRKWVVAMVMRVYHPGSKFDWMPVFEGKQEAGKSSFGKILVGDKYFLDWLPNLNDKDSALGLQGMWGVEMAELSQFKRNEIESIKAFITRTVDKFRPPFGRRLIESPRRCVFFGTTNKKQYLIDETGNRRFKPLEVGKLNFKALERDRLQLFAEARYLFMEGHETERTLDLVGAAKVFERKIHQKKMIEDDSNSMEESMRTFIEKVQNGSIIFNLDKFKILDLFEGVGPLGGWKKENRNLQFAAKMLRRIGGKMRKLHGDRVWGFTSPLRGVGLTLTPPPKQTLC